MALGKRLINTGAAAAACTTDSTDPFGDLSGIALYNLDYDASTAPDGTDYSGTPTNVEFGVGGQINYGARFNGSSSYIQTSLSLNAASNSVSFWFNADSVGTQNPALYFNNRGGRIDITINGTGSDTATAANENILINSTTAITGWNFVSIVFTGWASSYSAGSYGSAITANVYLNGGSAVSLSPTPYGQSDGLRIGRSGGGYYYDGDIDQVRIFSKALSQSEVDTLYAETACVYTCTTDTVDFPTTNLAYYKLNNSATDETGSYDGTETNIEYRFGRFGQAAVFNGSSRIGTGITSLTNNLTISMWLNPSSVSSNGNWIFGNWNSTTQDIYIYINSSAQLIVNFDNQSGGELTVGSAGDFVVGNWIHFVVSMSSGNYVVYLNGVSVATHSTPTTSYNNGQDYEIGNVPKSSTVSGWNGLIDQVRIFSTALTSDQVTELYEEKPCEDTSNFKTVLYEGNGGSQYISNVGFQPDLVWIKDRDNTNHHTLFDSIRGENSILYSDLTNATGSGEGFASFDSNGFTLDTGYTRQNANGTDYVAWVWKGGGDAVSNTDGSITSQVSANTDAGFSIVKWTGDATSNATVGHGLNQEPEIYFLKGLDNGTDSWIVCGNSTIFSSPTTNFLRLNTTASVGSTTANSVGSNGNVINVGVRTYDGQETIAYCFHSVSGYSSIGSYSGTGSTGNAITGLGFQPNWLMVKRTDASGSWLIVDNRRVESNGNLSELFADTTTAETGGYDIDFTSDGFTLNTTTNNANASGTDNYIYMAFK